MLRAIIVDDEPAGIVTLRLFIEKYPETIKTVATTTDAIEAITLIEDFKPDVVFLDISMPVISGFQLLETLKFKRFDLIFTTAHKEYALQAIKNKAFDYLLKPIDLHDFEKCISSLRVKEKTEQRSMPKVNNLGLIEILVKDGIIYIKSKEIIRLEASGSYTIIYLDGGIKHTASKGIKEYEQRLDPTEFFRCHNSHIINLRKVEKFVNYEGFFAQMCDGSLADISRKNKDILLEKLKNI